MKARWERPRVLSIDQASEALGDCFTGTTATDTSCGDGQSTRPAGGTYAPHECVNGGLAAQGANCSLGSNPAD